jgi:hypothetical protein
MPPPVGRNLALSLPRRFICDLVHFAKKVPSVPMECRMDLSAVVAARAAAEPRASWCGIFMKAYARVAAENPVLRRAYLPFPRPHLYEHPINVACVGIERRYGDEEGAFFAHVRWPESQSLTELTRRLQHFKTAPIEEIGSFRRELTVSRLPRPVRRLLWWYGLNVSGPRRARRLGTFGVSVVASQGAAGLHLLSPLTTTLNYGVFQPDGTIDVRLTYDHRVLDGGTAARALRELERVLRSEIVSELELQRLVQREESPSDGFSPNASLTAGLEAGSVVPQNQSAPRLHDGTYALP